ncbi:hypothetical protein CLV35_0988 [Motilibacter peucedani]|uniref:Phytase-like domain-containing protein n=1 Tax=Motilibacter peucedani TaxID=598650 RepID=A0A420XUZ2_9ACTN|nr:esterase-like activity of phytase family protein [Motilibacter peucedani]RKS80551.1 hypothetical protein CLV35_0988 [Motilibacter peucedani]
MKKSLVVLPVAGLCCAAAAVPGASAAPAAGLHASADAYVVRHDHRINVDRAKGVLRNDTGAPLTITAHTGPTKGSLHLQRDGSFVYTPVPGATGTDSFTYTVSDAVSLYSTDLPPLAAVDGVAISGGAYGSSLTRVPGTTDEFYGLTDRGPNVDGPDGSKVEPLPSFVPAIGRFRFTKGEARLERVIPLTTADGVGYDGRVSTEADTGETITDLSGAVLAKSPDGYDPEGLVALADGTFWVSDEYGPYITHFDADGRALERLSPFAGTLPSELRRRVPNKGMEGLTVTPDGRTLVGIMQSALQQTPEQKAKNVVPVRIVTVSLVTGATHEYLYLLHDPKQNSGAVSEITALSATRFLVDERDGGFPAAGGFKRLYTVDVSHATDVGPAAQVPGATYDGAHGGLLVGGRTIEELAGDKGVTATAADKLAAAGIVAGTDSLTLDLDAVLGGLDPAYRFFAHDKVEGVTLLDGGRTLVISNDSDFGISGLVSDTPPFVLQPKTTTAGVQDDGEYLVVDTTRLAGAASVPPAHLRTATVTLTLPRRR